MKFSFGLEGFFTDSVNTHIMNRARWIIDRFTRGDHPKSVNRRFRHWLASGENSLDKEAGLEDVWDRSADTDIEVSCSEWTRLEKAITGNRKKRSLAPFYRAAAVSVIVAVTAVTAVELTKDHYSENVAQLSLYTKAGERQTVVLPDSTVVTLNSRSLVVYPERFSGKDRRIYVVGEAILNVTKDAERPFVVSTPNLNVEVLGTTFDISDYCDDASGFVVLKEGKVKVSLREAPDDPVYIAPGEGVTFTSGGRSLKKSIADVEGSFAWMSGDICFSGADIRDIARILEREFGLNVNVAEGKYDDVCVTAKFSRGDSLEDFLVVLKVIIPGFDFKVDDTDLYII